MVQHRADFHGSEEIDFSYENIGPEGAAKLSGILRRSTVSQELKRLKLKYETNIFTDLLTIDN